MRRTILLFLAVFVLTAAWPVPVASGFHVCEKEFQALQKAKAEVLAAKAKREAAAERLTERGIRKENAKAYLGLAREEMNAAEWAYARARDAYAECVVANADKPAADQDIACLSDKAEMDRRGVLYNSAYQAYKDAMAKYDTALKAWADAMEEFRQAEMELELAYQKCAKAYAAYMTCMARFA